MAITRIWTPKGSDNVGNTNFSEENTFVSKLFIGNHGTDPSLSFSIPKIFFKILIGAIIGVVVLIVIVRYFNRKYIEE